MIDGQHSEPKPVASGVPQGSVLGPILFIIYINDLHDVVKNCKTGHFADETKLKGKIGIAEDTLDVQEDLNSVIIAWYMKNNMSLHEDKFIYLRYCTNKSTLLNELPFTAEYAEYDTTSGYAFKARGGGGGVNVIFSVFTYVTELLKTNK